MAGPFHLNNQQGRGFIKGGGKSTHERWKGPSISVNPGLHRAGHSERERERARPHAPRQRQKSSAVTEQRTFHMDYRVYEHIYRLLELNMLCDCVTGSMNTPVGPLAAPSGDIKGNKDISE